MKSKVKVLCFIFLGFWIALSIMPGICAEAKTVKLTLISAYAKDRLWNKHLFQWMDKVKENSGGRIVIEWRGGPEVVSPFENLAPVSKGMFDLLSTTSAYHPNVVPDATFIQLSDTSPMDLRRLGVINILDDVYRKKVNLTVLGWAFHGAGFGTLTVPPVKKLDDLKGMKARVVPQWIPVAKAYGMVPVNLSIPETYSALEKGIVDAVLFVLDPTIDENGWYEQLKYIITSEMLYRTTNPIFMNVDSWNRLSKEDQGILVDAIKALEPEMYKFYVQLTQKEIERAISKGLTEVEFSEAEAREYMRLQFQAQWKEAERMAPETAAKMAEILPIPEGFLPR